MPKTYGKNARARVKRSLARLEKAYPDCGGYDDGTNYLNEAIHGIDWLLYARDLVAARVADTAMSFDWGEADPRSNGATMIGEGLSAAFWAGFHHSLEEAVKLGFISQDDADSVI